MDGKSEHLTYCRPAPVERPEASDDEGSWVRQRGSFEKSNQVRRKIPPGAERALPVQFPPGDPGTMLPTD